MFEAIHSTNVKIERQPQSSVAYGLRYYSATKDTNVPVTRSFLLKSSAKLLRLKTTIQEKGTFDHKKRVNFFQMQEAMGWSMKRSTIDKMLL